MSPPTAAGRMTTKGAIALSTALVFASSTLAAPLAEANFWNERRKAVEDQKTSRTSQQLAQLPQRLAAFGDALPNVSAAGAFNLSQVGQIPAKDFSNGSPRRAELGKLPAWLTSLPTIYGDIRKVHLAPNADERPLVVHIQDAHNYTDAQRNISAIINELGKSGQIAVVGLEGAAGAFDLKPYREFPVPGVMRDVADFLLQQHLIGGVEHAGWTAEKEPLLWGVETPDLYLANYQAFKDALPRQDGLRARLKSWDEHLAGLKEKIYSAPLAAWDQKRAVYHQGRLGLAPYLGFLYDAAAPGKGRFPNADLLRRALAMEEGLHFPTVEKERAGLIEKLAANLSEADLAALTQKSLLYRMGRLTYGGYYSYLRRLCLDGGIALNRYPAMESYIEYVLLSEQINKEALFAEISALENFAVEPLLKTEDQKTLHALSRDLLLTEKMANFNMTSPDWAAYQADRAAVLSLPERLEAFSRHAGVSFSASGQGSANQESFAADLSPFEAFCDNALKRDQALVDNLLAKMEKAGVRTAVLVAGGFHTDGMTALLEKRKASYVVVTPQIKEINADFHYLDFLRDKTPLEKLFSGEKIAFKSSVNGGAAAPLVPGGRETLATGTAATAAAVTAAERSTDPASSAAEEALRNFGAADVGPGETVHRVGSTALVRVPANKRTYYAVVGPTDDGEGQKAILARAGSMGLTPLPTTNLPSGNSITYLRPVSGFRTTLASLATSALLWIQTVNLRRAALIGGAAGLGALVVFYPSTALGLAALAAAAAAVLQFAARNAERSAPSSRFRMRLAVLAMLALAACGGNTQPEPAPETTTTTVDGVATTTIPAAKLIPFPTNWKNNRVVSESGTGGLKIEGLPQGTVNFGDATATQFITTNLDTHDVLLSFTASDLKGRYYVQVELGSGDNTYEYVEGLRDTNRTGQTSVNLSDALRGSKLNQRGTTSFTLRIGVVNPNGPTPEGAQVFIADPRMAEIPRPGVTPTTAPARPAPDTAQRLPVAQAKAVKNDFAVHVRNEGVKIIAHYLPWYEKGGAWNHWTAAGEPRPTGPASRNIAAVNHPLLGLYDSSDPEIIRLHIKTLRAAGVDGITVDYYGGTVGHDANMDAIMRVAEEENFTVAVMYEVRVAKGDPAVFERHIREILSRHVYNPRYGSAYQRVAGLPVIHLFGAVDTGMTPQGYAQAIANLERDGYVFALIGDTAVAEYAEPYFDILSGVQNWINYGALSSNPSWDANPVSFEDSARAAALRRAQQRGDFAVLSSVYTGDFNDGRSWAKNENRPARVLDGRNGVETRGLIDYASRNRETQRWVMVNAWNDWNENTQFEPSLERGFQPVWDLLRARALAKGEAAEPNEIIDLYEGATLRNFGVRHLRDLPPEHGKVFADARAQSDAVRTELQQLAQNAGRPSALSLATAFWAGLFPWFVAIIGSAWLGNLGYVPHTEGLMSGLLIGMAAFAAFRVIHIVISEIDTPLGHYDAATGRIFYYTDFFLLKTFARSQEWSHWLVDHAALRRFGWLARKAQTGGRFWRGADFLANQIVTELIANMILDAFLFPFALIRTLAERLSGPSASQRAKLSPDNLHFTGEALQSTAKHFQSEIDARLNGRKSSLALLDTYAVQPNGREQGKFITVDFGGTNLRVHLVELDGQGGHTKIAASEYKFTKKEISYAEGENRGQALFDRMAGQIQALVEQDRARTGRADETYTVGFIFSYPADLTDIRAATIREDAVGVKGFTAFRDVVGRNIVDLLGEALKSRNVSNVEVAAVANDTVGVQAVVTYQELGQGRSVPADIGLIVATGYNEAADLGLHGLRNFESGAYVPLEKYRTDLDRRLDEQSENPGEHLFEKMVSGKYLGELVRLAVQDQHLETGQFHWNRSRHWRRTAGRPYGFPSEFLSRMASGQTNELLAELGVGAYASPREKYLLESIARQVVERSARLVAASLVATFRQIEGREDLRDSHLVAADGSVFLYPRYEDMIKRAMAELIGESAAGRIQIRRTQDGTAVGGAVIAAAAQPAPIVLPARRVHGYNHLMPPVQKQLQFPHATVTPTDREDATLFPALWADGTEGLSETPKEGARTSSAEALRNQLARMRDRDIGRLLWHQPTTAQVTMARWLNEPENAGRRKSVLEAVAAEAARPHAGWMDRNSDTMEGSPEFIREALAVIVSLSSDLGMSGDVAFLSQLARIYNLERTVQRAAFEGNSIGRPPAADQENKTTVRTFYLPVQWDTQDDLTVLPTHQGTVDRLMEAIQAIESDRTLSDGEKRAAARNLVVFSANPNIGPAQFEIYLKSRIGFANHSLLALAENIRFFTPREHAGLVGEDGRADVGVLANLLGGEGWFNKISLSVITASYDDLNLEGVREHVRLFIVNALGKVVPMDIRESIQADLYVLIQA